MFRHSCGVCHFTNLQRPSDITLADFWGWEDAVPGFNDDDKGVSLVLCNTEKGRGLFEAVKERLTVKEVPIEKCIQPNLQHPTFIHPKRIKFEEAYKNNGFNYVLKKFGETRWRYKVKNKVETYLKSIMYYYNNR